MKSGFFLFPLFQSFERQDVKCGQSLKHFLWISFMVVNLCPLSPAFLGNSLKSFRTNLVWNKEDRYAGGEYLTLVRTKANKSSNKTGFSSALSPIFSLRTWAMSSINDQGSSEKQDLSRRCMTKCLLISKLTGYRQLAVVERTLVLQSGHPDN